MIADSLCCVISLHIWNTEHQGRNTQHANLMSTEFKQCLKLQDPTIPLYWIWTTKDKYDQNFATMIANLYNREDKSTSCTSEFSAKFFKVSSQNYCILICIIN